MYTGRAPPRKKGAARVAWRGGCARLGVGWCSAPDGGGCAGEGGSPWGGAVRPAVGGARGRGGRTRGVVPCAPRWGVREGGGGRARGVGVGCRVLRPAARPSVAGWGTVLRHGWQPSIKRGGSQPERRRAGCGRRLRHGKEAAKEPQLQSGGARRGGPARAPARGPIL
jgi:hypothetical protein